MRSIYFSIPFVLVAAGHTFAADMPELGRVSQSLVPANASNTGDFSWDGSYIGLKGNRNIVGKANVKRLFRKPTDVGVYAGYNVQNGKLVYGVEGDVNYLQSLKDADDHKGGSGVYGTARARAGYTVGRFLPYVTAGVAAGRLKSVGHEAEGSKARYGFVVGTGVDIALSDMVQLRTSYEYMKFNARDGDVFSHGVHKAGLGIAVKF